MCHYNLMAAGLLGGVWAVEVLPKGRLNARVVCKVHLKEKWHVSVGDHIC